MQFWLVKTEPETFSWEDQKKARVESWSGVRNYQARNNMKLMKKGDIVLFYHSGKERCIVGLVTVEREYYPDEDPKFVCVDVKTLKELTKPVSLQAIKNNIKLQDMTLLKQSRLSVMPIKKEHYEEILTMSNQQ